MKNTKITNKIALEMAIQQLTTTFNEMVEFNHNCCPGDEKDQNLQGEVINKLTKMLEQVEKKNTTKGDRKPTKTQLENENLINIIEEILSDNEPKTITDLQNSSDEIGELSNQKVSALLKKLVDCGKVEKYVEKKKTYFKMKNEQ